MTFIDVIFCFAAYIILLFFVVKRYQAKNIRLDDDNDDDDGGIEISNIPDLDLPPGVCLPDKPTHPVTSDPET